MILLRVSPEDAKETLRSVGFLFLIAKPLMITQTRARRKIADILKKNKVSFSDQLLTEIIASIFGSDEHSEDPLTPEGRKAMVEYANLVGFRQRWTTDMAEVFNALGLHPVEAMRAMFELLRQQKFYRESRHVHTPQKLLIALGQERGGENGQSKSSGKRIIQDDESAIRRDLEIIKQRSAFTSSR